jgi:hypothetical protein
MEINQNKARNADFRGRDHIKTGEVEWSKFLGSAGDIRLLWSWGCVFIGSNWKLSSREASTSLVLESSPETAISMSTMLASSACLFFVKGYQLIMIQRLNMTAMRGGGQNNQKPFGPIYLQQIN